MAKHNNQGGVIPPQPNFFMIMNYKKASFLCSLIGDDDALYRYSLQLADDEEERKEVKSCITTLSTFGERNSLNLHFNQDAVDYLVNFFTKFLRFTESLGYQFYHSKKSKKAKKAA